MAKEQKPPSVSGELDRTERIISKDNREIGAEIDPLALNAPSGENRLIEEQERGDMIEALKSAAIRRVLYRLMLLGGIEDADSDPNPIIMAHHAGRRSLAVDMKKAIRSVDGGAFYQMEREHESNLKSRESKRGAE